MTRRAQTVTYKGAVPSMLQPAADRMSFKNVNTSPAGTAPRFGTDAIANPGQGLGRSYGDEAAHMRDNAIAREDSPEMKQIAASRGSKKLDETYAMRGSKTQGEESFMKNVDSIVAKERLLDVEARKPFMHAEEKLDEMELEEAMQDDDLELELEDAFASKSSIKASKRSSSGLKKQRSNITDVEQTEEKIEKPHPHSAEAHRDTSYMSSMHTYFYIKKQEREQVEKEADFGPEVERKSKESAQQIEKENAIASALQSKETTQSIRQTQAKVKK